MTAVAHRMLPTNISSLVEDDTCPLVQRVVEAQGALRLNNHQGLTIDPHRGHSGGFIEVIPVASSRALR